MCRDDNLCSPYLPDVALHLRAADQHGPLAQPGQVGDARAVVEPQAAGVLEPPRAGVVDHLEHEGLGVQAEVQGQHLAQGAGVPGKHHLVTVSQECPAVTRLQAHLVITTEQRDAPHQTVVP